MPSLNYTIWPSPVEFLSGNWYCSSHSLDNNRVQFVVHLLKLGLVLAFYCWNCFEHHFSVCRIGTWNVIKRLVEVELHITHFEVVAFDLQISRKFSTIQCVAGKPLTRPEGLQFVVMATNLDRLMPVIVPLCYCENCRALLVSLIKVLLSRIY